MEEVKSHSSKWIKTKDEKLKDFYWQNGYGAFSVNPAEVDIVKSYIETSMSIIEKKLFRTNTAHF